MLAAASDIAVAQRGLDGDRGIQAGKKVSHRDTDLLRPAAGAVITLAGHAHQAAQALDCVVVARPIAVRAGLSEAGDGAVNEARLRGQQTRCVQAIASHVAHLEVLDQDIGPSGQSAHQGLPFGLGQVDGDGALVAVACEEVGRFPGVLASGVLQKRWAPAARVIAPGVPVAGGAFYLDHVGTQIGQRLGAPGPCEHPRQVKHAQPCERCQRRGGSLNHWASSMKRGADVRTDVRRLGGNRS